MAKLGLALQNIMAGDQSIPFPKVDIPTMNPQLGKPGFLAPGSKGALIAGILGDGLATLSGGQAVVLPQMMAQQRDAQRAQQEQVQWDRRRVADREDKQWEWANKPKEDDAYTRMMRAAGIDPTSPTGQALYKKKVERDASPFVTTTLPNGQFYAGPQDGLIDAITGATGPASPATLPKPRRLGPVVNAIPGGAGGNTSGGFRP